MSHFSVMVITSARAANGAVATFAIVKDGRWYERGEMCWWGVVHDDKWNKEFAYLLEGLPADTWLTIVDCHI